MNEAWDKAYDELRASLPEQDDAAAGRQGMDVPRALANDEPDVAPTL